MEIIFLVSIAWWIVKFEPLQLVFDFIFKQIKISHLSNYIHSSLGCWKCWSFWITLIVSHSFQLACLGALIAFTFELCLNKLNEK